MPYIKKELRDRLDPYVDQVRAEINCSISKDKPGMRNYSITRIVCESVRGPYNGPWSYDEIERVMAAFDCAKAEFYRRVAGPKEDQAAIDNGDMPCYE